MKITIFMMKNVQTVFMMKKEKLREKNLSANRYNLSLTHSTVTV